MQWYAASCHPDVLDASLHSFTQICLSSQHLTPLDSSTPAYQSSLFSWQQITFPHPGAHIVLSLRGNYPCTTVIFILLYALHFGRWSPLILHALWKHLFQVALSLSQRAMLRINVNSWGLSMVFWSQHKPVPVKKAGRCQPFRCRFVVVWARGARCDPDTCWSRGRQLSSWYSVAEQAVYLKPWTNLRWTPFESLDVRACTFGITFKLFWGKDRNTVLIVGSFTWKKSVLL